MVFIGPTALLGPIQQKKHHAYETLGKSRNSRHRQRHIELHRYLPDIQ